MIRGTGRIPLALKFTGSCKVLYLEEGTAARSHSMSAKRAYLTGFRGVCEFWPSKDELPANIIA